MDNYIGNCISNSIAVGSSSNGCFYIIVLDFSSILIDRVS